MMVSHSTRHIIVSNTCLSFSSCADISHDSRCFEHVINGTHLNYTDELDLAELERYVFNYIEINVTETCRDYLKVAVCVTIYPPCTDNGTTVQQLCAENCEALLIDGICTQEATSVIDTVNDFVADPIIDFTFNCPNSSSFAEAFLNTSLCLDECCFVMTSAAADSTNVATTTAMPTPIAVPERYAMIYMLVIKNK